MTVARCLEKFKREYAWSFKMCNWATGSIGYSREKDIDSRRHAYKMLLIWINDLSIRQLKNLYKRILYWLEEVISND